MAQGHTVYSFEFAQSYFRPTKSETESPRLEFAISQFCYTILYCPPLSRKRGDIKSHSSVRPSVRHKNFNLGHNFCNITGRALILGMCVLCDKTFPMVPCRDLDGDFWPTSRSNLLPSGGPQFSEFACYNLISPGLNLPLGQRAKIERGRNFPCIKNSSQGQSAHRDASCYAPGLIIMLT